MEPLGSTETQRPRGSAVHDNGSEPICRLGPREGGMGECYIGLGRLFALRKERHMSVEERATVNPNPYSEEHIQKYLVSNGKDVDHPAGDSLILLYTTGRKSGEIRRVPLGSFPDGDALVVIGSNAGRPEQPEWYKNLVASPRVWVRKQSDFYEAEASVLQPEQRQVFWDNLTAQIPMFAQYQENSGRELPLIRLTGING